MGTHRLDEGLGTDGDDVVRISSVDDQCRSFCGLEIGRTETMGGLEGVLGVEDL